MKKKLRYWPPGRKGGGVVYKTGEDNVTDIVIGGVVGNETDASVTAHFEDGSLMVIGNMPYEYAQRPEE